MTIVKGTVKSFNSNTYKASVQLIGSLAVWLDDVTVARNIAATEMTSGRKCAVLLFNEADPRDAVVVGVYT